MPLVGVAAGVIVLDEDFYWQECFGAGGILSGVYLLTQARQILHRRNVRRRAHYRAARQRMQAIKSEPVAYATGPCFLCILGLAAYPAVMPPFSTVNRAAPGAAARSTSTICGWQVK